MPIHKQIGALSSFQLKLTALKGGGSDVRRASRPVRILGIFDIVPLNPVLMDGVEGSEPVINEGQIIKSGSMSTRAAKPWRRRKAASAVARKRAMAGQARVFARGVL